MAYSGKQALLPLLVLTLAWNHLFGIHTLAIQAASYRVSRPGDLFYNFYVGPSPRAGGTAAELYPAPLPAPPLVGYTYITYQPMMPHEMLYRHSRTYYRHQPCGGWVQTKVHWW